MNDLRETARSYYEVGLNVLPASKDKKHPVLRTWKQYASERPKTFEEAFPVGLKFDALFIVCGPTSGGLEVLDFDQEGKAFEPFKAKCETEIFSLVTESTQHNGVHIAFRSDYCERNQKLAMDKDKKVLIETRGDGGGVIVAPSEGYAVLSGSWLRVRRISQETRNAIIETARSFNETPSRTAPKKKNTRQTVAPIASEPTIDAPLQNESIADYLKRIEEGKRALERCGWTFLRREGGFEHWKRPNQEIDDKPGGSWSVSEGYFHVFTTNAYPLEADRSYSNLQLVASLEFNGDERACSKHYVKHRPLQQSQNAVISTLSCAVDVLPELSPREPKQQKTKNDLHFPDALYNLDGTIGELTNITNKYAIRPQPEGAFLGALACQSYMCGRTLALNYNGTLVTPNIHALFLAPSGMGKEAIRRTCAEVARAYYPDESIPESFASVQALQNMIIRLRKIMWLHDEFGRDLAVMSGKQSNSNLQGLITESLKVYSNANNPHYLPKVIAQEAKGSKKPEAVDRPSLTIFATGNPREYYEATNEVMVRNGYIPRFSTVLGRSYSAKIATTYEQVTSAKPFVLPADLRSRVKAWRDFECAASSEPFIVSFSSEAFDCIYAFDETLERNIRDDIGSGGTSSEFIARISEKTWKYALLITASKYGARRDLRVDQSCAELAVDFAQYEVNFFESNRDRFASSEQSKLAFDILDWARSLGRDFTKSEFTRKFQRRGTLRERNEALDTLLEGAYLFRDSNTNTYVVTDEK